jgi:hypothetical protein
VATFARASRDAASPEARRAIMTKIAETLADKLDDKTEAILVPGGSRRIRRRSPR